MEIDTNYIYLDSYFYPLRWIYPNAEYGIPSISFQTIPRV